MSSQYMKQELTRLREENEELREEVLSLRQYIVSLKALVEAIDQLDPTSEIMPLLDRILYNALTVIDAKDGSLLVIDDDTGELVFVLVYGEAADKGIVGYRLPPNKGIAGWAVKNKKPTVANKAYSDTRFYTGIDDVFQFQTESVLAVPIIAKDRVLGVIEVLNKHDGQPFNETDQTLLMLLCRFAGQVLHEMVQREEAQAESEPSDAPQATATPPQQ